MTVRPMEQRAYAVREFCEAYGICRATFYNEVRRGHLRAIKLGAKTLVLREDAESWAARLPTLPNRGLVPIAG